MSQDSEARRLVGNHYQLTPRYTNAPIRPQSCIWVVARYDRIRQTYTLRNVHTGQEHTQAFTQFRSLINKGSLELVTRQYAERLYSETYGKQKGN